MCGCAQVYLYSSEDPDSSRSFDRAVQLTAPTQLQRLQPRQPPDLRRADGAAAGGWAADRAADAEAELVRSAGGAAAGGWAADGAADAGLERLMRSQGKPMQSKGSPAKRPYAIVGQEALGTSSGKPCTSGNLIGRTHLLARKLSNIFRASHARAEF